MSVPTVLIGMSGAGKTTVGRILAGMRKTSFIDSDDVIRERSGRNLEQLLASGDENFIKTEEAVLFSLPLENSPVVATGGSAVYSPKAMRHLRLYAEVVFLDVPVEILERRVEPQGRGIVGLGGKTYRQLAKERHGLYTLFSDFTVLARNEMPEQIAAKINLRLNERRRV